VTGHGMRPTLLNGCASAATAAEARFRIDGPITGRSARVVGLDAGAAEVVGRVAEQPWSGASFFTAEDPTPAGGGDNGASTDVLLRGLDGSTSPLSEELEDADLVVMIATSDDGAQVAASIAKACAQRGIMMAGLILGDRVELSAAVSALRPYAPVLMVSGDEDDVSELLTALRA
jgi:hypothetical protein